MPNPHRPPGGNKKEAAPAADGGEGDESEAEVPPKPEKNADIIDALLERRSITTGDAKKELKRWASWHCGHCDKDFEPGANFADDRTLFNSDVSKSICDHFMQVHCEGPQSAYAAAAPNKYKLLFFKSDGEMSDAEKLRLATSVPNRGVVPNRDWLQ